MIQPGTPVTIANPASSFYGQPGDAVTYPHPFTDSVNVALAWVPGKPALSFGADELQVDCPVCQSREQGDMAPAHRASDRCESGKRDHCSCSVCF